MKKQFSEVRWRRVGFTAVMGVALVLVAHITYTNWRQRDGWCIRFFPDGSEKVLYGAECQRLD